MENKSDTDRTFCLVSGYHQCSFPPIIAYSNGLRHRFAIVLDTYRRSKVDMFFDIELFLHIVPRLCETIGFDSAEIVMPDNGIRFHIFEDYAQHFSERGEVDWEPPEQIELIQKKQLVGFVETEYWTLHGGPSPYHDSYTFSFYTAEDRSEEFRKICELESANLGAQIAGYYKEEQLKEPYQSRAARIWKWFKRSLSSNHLC